MNEFDDLVNSEMWQELPPLLDHLPEPVSLVMWGEPDWSTEEAETARLGQALAAHFKQISFFLRPRRINYDYYPVIGIMGAAADDSEEWHDYGVRIIGMPAGYQMTSLITAIQAVSFRGMNLEPKTRIQLSRLDKRVEIEVVTADDNEGGPILAQTAFGMAVVNPHIRSFLIMANQFPAVTDRYSIEIVPHTVINGRVHVSGLADEERLLQQIAHAVKTAPLT